MRIWFCLLEMLLFQQTKQSCKVCSKPCYGCFKCALFFFGIVQWHCRCFVKLGTGLWSRKNVLYVLFVFSPDFLPGIFRFRFSRNTYFDCPHILLLFLEIAFLDCFCSAMLFWWSGLSTFFPLQWLWFICAIPWNGTASLPPPSAREAAGYRGTVNPKSSSEPSVRQLFSNLPRLQFQ